MGVVVWNWGLQCYDRPRRMWRVLVLISVRRREERCLPVLLGVALMVLSGSGCGGVCGRVGGGADAADLCVACASLSFNHTASCRTLQVAVRSLGCGVWGMCALLRGLCLPQLQPRRLLLCRDGNRECV